MIFDAWDAAFIAACILASHAMRAGAFPGWEEYPVRYRVYRYGLNGRHVWRVQKEGLSLEEKTQEDARLLRMEEHLPDPVALPADAREENARIMRDFLTQWDHA